MEGGGHKRRILRGVMSRVMNPPNLYTYIYTYKSFDLRFFIWTDHTVLIAYSLVDLSLRAWNFVGDLQRITRIILY